MPDGTTDVNDVLHHNNWVNAGLQAMQNLNNGDGEGDADRRRELDGYMFQAVARMVNYAYDSTLGRYMSRAFKDPALRNRLFRRALNRPSETVKVIYKTIRDRHTIRSPAHPGLLRVGHAARDPAELPQQDERLPPTGTRSSSADPWARSRSTRESSAPRSAAP